MDNLFLSASSGFLVGLAFVGIFMLARILKVLTEIRDAAQQNK